MTPASMSKRSDLKLHRIPLRLSNAYLIQRHNKGILIDAGSPGEADRILKRLQNFGVDQLEWVFITHAHYDHMGSAAEIKQATGAQVVIHADDADALAEGATILGEVRGRGHLTAWLLPMVEKINPVEPVEADVVFKNEQFVIPDPEIKIEAYHLPGHTLGSAGLFVDGTHLFAGDLISTTGTPHPQRFYAQDWEALRNSLMYIQELKPALSYPGHGPEALELEGLMRLRI
jgi:glyoxylase-like metal-dependent hydrolase (beta-lactamase superfamily II)